MTANERAGVSAASRTEFWFDSNGSRLYAVEIGHGVPLVFLHGGLADHRAALVRVGDLAASHRILVPDLRGSGRSTFSGALSWDVFADDVSALLDHLGLERAVVGGTSMGAGVALRFALRHPHRTLGAILMSPLYPGQDRGLPDAAVAAMRVMDSAAQRALVEGIEALAPLYDQLSQPVRERALQMMRGFDVASVAATTRFLASCVQPLESARLLRALDAPVLLIPGTDAEHPPEVSELYAEQLRNVILVHPAASDVTAQLACFCSAVSEPHRPVT